MAKKWYTLIVRNLTTAAVDAASTCFWSWNGNTASSQCRVYPWIAWRITEITLSFVNTVLWSNESSSVYINKNWAATETLLSSSIKNNTSNTNYTITWLNINLTTADYINIQFVWATRATNPTFNLNAFIYIQ